MAIVVDGTFTFLHMPKTGGISAYNLLHKVGGDANHTMQYHVVWDKVPGAEGLPIVIGSRDVETWHKSYYNYVFRQMADRNYHIHELFKRTPTFEEFLDFSYTKACDFGKDMNNPANAYGGFDYVTTMLEDWWDYDGHLYDYVRDHLLCGQRPDYTIRQEHIQKDWLAALNDLGLLTKETEDAVVNMGRYNQGAFQ